MSNDLNLPTVQFAQQIRSWGIFSKMLTALAEDNIQEALKQQDYLKLVDQAKAATDGILCDWIITHKWWEDPADSGFDPFKSLIDCFEQITHRSYSSCMGLVRTWRYWRENQRDPDQFVKDVMTIGWWNCREIRHAKIPSKLIDQTVETIASSGFNRDGVRILLHKINPHFSPDDRPWERWTLRVSDDAHKQMDALFDDLAKIYNLDRTLPGNNDQIVSILYNAYFSAKGEE